MTSNFFSFDRAEEECRSCLKNRIHQKTRRLERNSVFLMQNESWIIHGGEISVQSGFSDRLGGLNVARRSLFAQPCSDPLSPFSVIFYFLLRFYLINLDWNN
ncbi:hypothetical protein TNCV_1640771 [Trichonephila clavipes]|nr:hypothetical protein TNCV_1640771 [Trichonephila clavipes]